MLVVRGYGVTSLVRHEIRGARVKEDMLVWVNGLGHVSCMLKGVLGLGIK